VENRNAPIEMLAISLRTVCQKRCELGNDTKMIDFSKKSRPNQKFFSNTLVEGSNDTPLSNTLFQNLEN